jgi:uncharacterized delta-60 repeat protein
VVGGYSVESKGANSAVLASFTASGATDSGTGGFGQTVKGKVAGYTKESLGASAAATFYATAIQPDDKVVSVGNFISSSTNSLLVARHTAAGKLDTTFNGSGYSVLNLPGNVMSNGVSVALDSNGKIVVGGVRNDGTSDNVLAVRYNTDGTLDTTFGGGNGYVRVDVGGSVRLEIANGVAIQPDGKIVLAGEEGSVSAPDSMMVARLNTDGTLDTGFGAGGIKLGSPTAGAVLNVFRGQAVALQSDGSIIVAGFEGGYLDPNTWVEYPMLMRFSGGAAELAAGGASPTLTSTPPLTPSDLQPIVDQAIARWDESGLTAKQDQTLHSAVFSIGQLSGGEVGDTFGNHVTIDPTAAGYGWFVDPTPADDSEFPARPGSAAYRGMDLLTVVEHELGHVLGLQHSPIPGDVMDESLPTGVRRQPHAFEAAATPGEFVSASMVSTNAPAVAPLIPSLPTTHDMPSVRDQVLAAWDDELIGGKLLQ